MLAASRGGAHAPRLAPLAAWLASLAVGLVVFHAMGDGPLAPPPLAPSGWADWAAARDPLVATVAVLRLFVLGLAWYLVGATSIGVLARLARRARLIRLADALTVPALRRFLQATLGATLASVMVVSATTPAPTSLAASSVTMAAHEGEASATTMTLRPSGDATLPPPLALVGVERDRAPDVLADAAPDAIAAAEPADEPQHVAATEAVAPADDRGVGEHVVEAGDSLWSIAEVTLADAWQRAPSDVAVAAYWREVIEHNRSRLADPEQPDLIFPGDRIVLPPAPAPEDGP